MAKVEKHPSGVLITFDPKWHTYKCPQLPHLRFTSGTKFLKRFFSEFDKEGISKRYAQKHGLSQEDVLAGWARKGEVSRESGTLVHGYLENLANGVTMSYENAAKHPDADINAMALSKMKSADKVFNDISADYDILFSEMIVAHLKERVAGQVDLLGRHKVTKKIAFFDYKTNAEIKFENRWQNCLAPISEFEDCSFVQYSLQLGLYALIAEQEGYLEECGWQPGDEVEKFIVHITEDPESSMIYPCMDMREKISQMFSF
jgi:hypothetical protein